VQIVLAGHPTATIAQRLGIRATVKIIAGASTRNSTSQLDTSFSCSSSAIIRRWARSVLPQRSSSHPSCEWEDDHRPAHSALVEGKYANIVKGNRTLEKKGK
jgi:hypothetical protein